MVHTNGTLDERALNEVRGLLTACDELRSQLRHVETRARALRAMIEDAAAPRASEAAARAAERRAADLARVAR